MAVATPRVAVTGLFVEPRDAPLTVPRPLGEPPPSPFAAWDRSTTVLYDVVSGTEMNLGPGQVGWFSPDGTRMVWIRGTNDQAGEAILLDIRTMEQRTLGTARLAFFIDDDRVYLAPNGGTCESLDLNTNARTARVCSPPDRFEETPDGYQIVGGAKTETGGTYSLLDEQGETLLSLEAYRAVPAGPGWLAVASEIQQSGEPDAAGVQPGTTNVFLIEIATGEATFIATSPWRYANWPLAASDRYVVWTDDYCAYPNPGTTKVYDRATGEIADLQATLWGIDITDGLLREGPFGGRALIDLENVSYRAVLPGGEPQWSPDRRYASIGRVGGHGGLCP